MGSEGRIYRIPLARTSVTTAVDIAEILTSATQIMWVHEIEVSQSTAEKDAGEDILQLAWRVGNATTGSGGATGVVATPQIFGDPVSGLTIEIFNTTKATGGTPISNPLWDWLNRATFDKVFTPSTMLFVKPATIACLELVAAPAVAMTIGGVITVELVSW